MAATDVQSEGSPEPQAGLERGTYEVLRGRLTAAGQQLRERLEKLNAARKAVFGAIETKLLATERITTDHNCVPRDMTSVGHCFLFGYNVHLGLKSTVVPSDVLAVYEFKDRTFTPRPLDLIADPRFGRDFEELYKYYRNTRFAKFARIGPHLFMVFRVGKDLRDIKTFKWLVEGDRLVYLDNRSDHEYRFPPQHEFEWTRTRRDMHVVGQHPHVSIEDRLFVETVGGDLTIKIENNTESGEGIYSEPVDNPDQTLDDAEFLYAIVGNLILLRIRPYQESKYRHFVYSEKTRQVVRIDAIEDACVLLPDDQGLIFANGYILQTGVYKTFENALSPMVFRERIQSPNGEDYLYAFYQRQSGVFILLPYNLIEQKVATPIVCNGFSLFDDGTLLYFKRPEEPQKHHAIQIWQTPYVGPNFQLPAGSDGFLQRVGNRDIVRGMAECHEILDLLGKEDSYAGLFIDLAKQTGVVLDTYHWLGHEEAFNLRECLLRIKEAADAAIGEFEKVTSVRRATEAQLREVSERVRQIAASIRARRFEVIGDFVTSLADMRSVRGEIIALRSLRYIDNAQVDALETEIQEHATRVAQSCVSFLLGPTALAPYETAVAEHRAKIDALQKAADARQLDERVSQTAGELEMLVETVSNLKIDDATQRTTIIDRISALFSQINQVRAALKNKLQDLARNEGVAEFSSQLKLLSQSVVNYLDVCDTPEKCEEYLTKMMVQVEELEGRFADFDEFVLQLTEKRQEVYNAFETRKVQLVEARNRRATALAAAADRILKGIKARVDSFTTINEINGYFASDLMIEKVRDIVKSLAELGDSVKVDDIQSRLKTIHEDAARQLKDRQDLYEDGENVIRFGQHRFSVNRQAFDLTTVLRDGQMYFHLSGTNYFDAIESPQLLETRDVWEQEVVSENREVYRGEYLAYQLFRSLGRGGLPSKDEVRRQSPDKLLALVQQFIAPRYTEGYAKGVHDHDATILLGALLKIDATIGLLRYHPRARALASVFWHQFDDAPRKQLLTARLAGFGAIRELFPETDSQQTYVAELQQLLREYVAEHPVFPESLVEQAGEYLFEELIRGDSFVTSPIARDLYRAFHSHLQQKQFADKYRDLVGDLKRETNAAFRLQRDWVNAFLATRDRAAEEDYVEEVASLLLTESFEITRVVETPLNETLTGLAGNHPLLKDGTYQLDFNQFLFKLQRYEREIAPRFEAFGKVKKELLDAERERLRLDEFRPRVLTTFVRNKLLDQVYLPLIGSNLAKQIGVVGEQKRTDRMGMLLLISPPGYGKTTLMEYIANRLGIVFMKINGPALGHRITSLDPVEAPNAAAREELEKLNLAFEMGDNVMIYVDDIQHCNPEFLQKFISLCDAQRKIEGVWRGRTRTYDLRGKKVAVVMAGNPYTESGEMFKIPDMLANRADTYNLGDIVGTNGDAFRMSYLENSLTSNPVLDKLASRSQNDVYTLLHAAETGTAAPLDLEGNYSQAEIQEMLAVTRKLLRVRDVVLRVNEEYIRSAATSDEYRTEPPFKLQGSYRNMNRIAERVVAVMNDEELEELILASYQNDAQTLTTGSESNMLKFKALTGRQTPEEATRWNDIKKTYTRNVKLRGVGDDDKFGQLLVELGCFSDGLGSIEKALHGGLERMLAAQTQKRPDGEPTVKAALDGPTLDLLRQWFEGFQATLAEFKDAIADRPPEPAVPPATPEVQIVNKVPSSILGVLRNQFRLLEGWLLPLRQESQEQRKELHRVRELLTQTLGSYKVLITQLEEAARNPDVLDTLARHKLHVQPPKQNEE